ncbi:MAG: hypothetical protein GYB42_03465 [Alphaproteobacteria bacterium]|nr:hypothetical protein [Alphaproteobacteria bacterium]
MTQRQEKLTLLQRLARNKNGNVAMIFGLTIIPIISVAGFAIDFQMTTTRKNKVQMVMDSAVLAGARAMQANKTQDEIRETVNNYVEGQLATIGETLRCGDVDISFPEETKDINLDVLCYQDTSLMKIVGHDKMGFRVRTASTWGIGKLDVAFMFDVSGSMATNDRIVHLKDAAKDALDTLLPVDGGAATEEVRIAMMSYNSMVNAGDYFEDVTGLAKERTYHANNTFTRREKVGTRTERQQVETCVTERVCTRYRRNGSCRTWDEQATCSYEWQDVEVDVYDDVVVSEPVSRTVTSTCVWERPGEKKFSDFAPSDTVAGYPAPITPKSDIQDADHPIYNAGEEATNPYGYLAAGYAIWDDDRDRWREYGTSDCPSTESLALTNNRTKLDNYVTSLRTGGGTAGQQGVAWSWYLIAQPWQSIFTGTSAPLNYNERDSIKAVILMTDGAFNRAAFESEQGDSDTQARAVCDAMKDNGRIIIYTVAFEAPDEGKDVLAYCASAPEFAFTPENGAELTEAYQAIAVSISDLRISY